jgi:hypothetical protein
MGCFAIILVIVHMIAMEIKGMIKYGRGNYRVTIKGLTPTREWKKKHPNKKI